VSTQSLHDDKAVHIQSIMARMRDELIRGLEPACRREDLPVTVDALKAMTVQQLAELEFDYMVDLYAREWLTDADVAL